MTNFLMVAFYFLLELVKNKSANLKKRQIRQFCIVVFYFVLENKHCIYC